MIILLFCLFVLKKSLPARLPAKKKINNRYGYYDVAGSAFRINFFHYSKTLSKQNIKKINQLQPSPNFYISLIFLQWLSLLGALRLAVLALVLLMFIALQINHSYNITIAPPPAFFFVYNPVHSQERVIHTQFLYI